MELVRKFGPYVAVELFVPGLAVSRDASDAGILEDRGVELRGLFGLIVEPEAGGDLLNGWHGGSPVGPAQVETTVTTRS